MKTRRYIIKRTLILGNFITMDEKRPFAKAALVKDGVFAYIGVVEEAKKVAGDRFIVKLNEQFH